MAWANDGKECDWDSGWLGEISYSPLDDPDITIPKIMALFTWLHTLTKKDCFRSRDAV